MQGIYPTAPAGMQQPPDQQGGLAPAPAHGLFAEGGDHVESPGNSKSPLSKVKHRARNLKAKLKKVAGSNTANTHDDEELTEDVKLDQQARAYPSHANKYGHDDVDGVGKDSYVDDEEERDDQSKYEQIHPIAAMDKNGDGPDLHDVSHEQPEPSQSQDMPYTSYNHVPSADISRDRHGPSPSDDMPYKSYDHADHSYSPVTDMLSQRESASSQSPTASGLNVAYPDDIVKPNPEFGHSLSPMRKKIAVINEDLPAETRQDNGLAPVKDFGIQQSFLDNAVPENAPINLEEADKSVDMPAADTVARSSLTSPGNVVPATTYAMTGGQKIGSNEQEVEGGSPFTGCSADSFEKNKRESTPAIWNGMGGRSKDEDSSSAEYASKRDGTVHKKALSGTLAGSKLQGLGLTDDTHPDTPSAEDVSTPQASESSESTGILQGLRNTVTSTLGYGGQKSPKPSYERENRAHEAVPSELEQPNVEKQNGGALQGLKNVLASKLGYGGSKEPLNDQTMYNENGEHANAVKAGHNNSDEGVERHSTRKPAGDNAMEDMAKSHQPFHQQ